LARIGIAPALPRGELNRTADLVTEYDARRWEIPGDHRMMAQLPDLFADDLRFYERYMSRSLVQSDACFVRHPARREGVRLAISIGKHK
jgi:hypothetical protein